MLLIGAISSDERLNGLNTLKPLNCGIVRMFSVTDV